MLTSRIFAVWAGNYIVFLCEIKPNSCLFLFIYPSIFCTDMCNFALGKRVILLKIIRKDVNS